MLSIPTLFAVDAQRKLRRGDIVELPTPGMFVPGRVWRRIDADHVQVVDCGLYVTIYREDHLKLSTYRGTWKWGRHPGNHEGKTPRWLAMTSLKLLKRRARKYYPHFGGTDGWGRPWSKGAREDALAEREVWRLRTQVRDIVWDKEVDGVEQDVDLPTRVLLDGIDHDKVADALSDAFGFCVKSFTAEDQVISFPGYSK